MHPLLISLLFTIVGIIAYIVHQKSRHEEVENINIAKTAVLSFGLSVASIYTYMYLSDASGVSGSIEGGSIGGGSGIEQDIMVGNPNF
jgi:hypothetical protein